MEPDLLVLLYGPQEPSKPHDRPENYPGRVGGSQRRALPRLPAQRATPGSVPPQRRPGPVLLSGWILWARRCGIADFEKLCRTIERCGALIGHTLDHNVTNVRSEATNTHIRALTKRAYGYHSPEALIGMAMLTPTRAKLTHGNVRRSIPKRLWEKAR